MIVLDFQLGRFDVVVERDSSWGWHPFKVTHIAPGDIAIDLPYFTILYANHRRWNAAHNSTVSQ